MKVDVLPANDLSGIPNSNGGAKVSQFGIFKARHHTFQGLESVHGLFSSFHFSFGQVFNVQRVQSANDTLLVC